MEFNEQTIPKGFRPGIIVTIARFFKIIEQEILANANFSKSDCRAEEK